MPWVGTLCLSSPFSPGQKLESPQERHWSDSHSGHSGQRKQRPWRTLTTSGCYQLYVEHRPHQLALNRLYLDNRSYTSHSFFPSFNPPLDVEPTSSTRLPLSEVEVYHTVSSSTLPREKSATNTTTRLFTPRSTLVPRPPIHLAHLVRFPFRPTILLPSSPPCSYRLSCRFRFSPIQTLFQSLNLHPTST